MNPRFGTVLLALSSAAVPLVTAQSTQPHLSTFVGGTGGDEIVAVRRGPGGLITVIGHTSSIGLGTLGAFQPVLAGARDAFVARFNPTLPPNRQLLWWTYLGGVDLEIAFDGEVDPITGTTTVVGLTRSAPFPGGGSPNGSTDGFVAQIDAAGAALTFVMLSGIPGDDRFCEVEVDARGVVNVAGVIETANGLPAPTNAYRGGPTDAFVQLLVPSSPPTVLWSTYLGGSSTEGMTFAAWAGSTLWWGNLDRMAMTVDAGGDAVLATASFQASIPAQTTSCASQGAQAGQADVYLAKLNAQGALTHGTFFGGNGDDYPNAVAVHPDGGVVLGGVTWSTTLPVTVNCLQNSNRGGAPGMGGASDGFVCWIDPARCGSAAVRYATYLGGNAGQDAVFGVAVETSGMVTVAGLTAGGNFWTTPRSLQSTLPAGSYGGMVARIALEGGGSRDLQYASFVGDGAILNSVALDDLGDAWLAGASWGRGYPIVNAWQPASAGGREGVLTHMPLLAGGIVRQGLGCATPACGTPLHTSAGDAPLPGRVFDLRALNAPPMAPGAVLIGVPLPCTPLPPLNVNLLLTGFVSVPVAADRLGAAAFELAIPPGLPVVPSWGLGAQWIFATGPSCPGSGPLAASERLAF